MLPPSGTLMFATFLSRLSIALNLKLASSSDARFLKFAWLLCALLNFEGGYYESTAALYCVLMFYFLVFQKEVEAGLMLSSTTSLEHSADWHSPEWRHHRKHIFILSCAGKPIYTRYVPQ